MKLNTKGVHLTKGQKAAIKQARKLRQNKPSKAYYSLTAQGGFHVGQTDDPQKIVKQIFESVGDCESVVFKLDENSQFYSKFSAFYKVV